MDEKGLGDDDKVRHGIYDRNFRDLFKGFKVLKDDINDITALSNGSRTINNGVQTLYIVNDDSYARLDQIQSTID